MKTRIYFLRGICILFCISFSAQAQTITTIAGTGVLGFSGDGGAATMAQLYSPRNLVLDTSGNIYFTDLGNNRVRKIDLSGNISTIAGNGSGTHSGDGGPATAAGMQPGGVTIDTFGNLYITDVTNDVIRKVDATGTITTVAGSTIPGFAGDGGPATAARLSAPYTVTVDSVGNIFIADHANYRIRKVNTSGIISTIAGNGSSFNTGDGGQATAAGIGMPVSIVFDNAGNMYFSDRNNSKIRKINTSGIISTIAGSGGSTAEGAAATATDIGTVDALRFDTAGNLYYSDDSKKVRRISTSGIVTTFAGSFTTGYAGDGGPATAAQLNRPGGIDFDAAGNMYICDLVNQRIRKVSVPSTSTLSAVQANVVRDNIIISPNPNRGTFRISGILASATDEAIAAEVVNMLGQVVFKTTIAVQKGQVNAEMAINKDLPGGLYVLHMHTGGVVKTIHFAVER